jgi:hypothetical protein
VNLGEWELVVRWGLATRYLPKWVDLIVGLLLRLFLGAWKENFHNDFRKVFIVCIVNIVTLGANQIFMKSRVG